MQQTFIVP